ncbi:MAG TPA: phage terminase large subunit family protein, partial [Blastocatellia bacterium]|nr:phage terminase large subunit family protein [Blastocatellia bacterium]
KAVGRPAVKAVTTGWQRPAVFADWRNRARARLALDAREEIRQEVATQQGETMELLEWAQVYRSIDDQPFSLARFKPLEAIYRDDHPQKVIIKPAQVGVSEYAITLAVWAMVAGFRLWSTVKKGINVGYLFPTQSALRDFSKERFSGLKRETSYLAALFDDGEFDEVGFKQIADSYLYLRGAWSVAGLKSFPADLLIFDEYDEMDPAAIQLGRKRVRQSPIKREVYISTPTLPEIGIHGLYLASDQRVWEVECGNCREHHELDYFRDVRADGKSYDKWKRWNKEQVALAKWSVACPSCQGILDRFGPGRWTARRPEVTVLRGYHVPSLCFPAVSLEELGLSAISKDPTVLTEFYRSDLGLPYTAAGSRISVDMLLKLFAELEGGELPSTQWTRVTMGVDVGAEFHYRVDATGADGRRYCLAMGAVESWERVAVLMNQYSVRSCVVDAQPEHHGAKAFCERFKGRVKRAFYPSKMTQLFRVASASPTPKSRLQKRAEKQLGHAGDDIEPDVVHIHRTMAMDAVFAQISAGDVLIPESIVRVEEVQKHLCAPVRVVTRDGNGQELATWQHTTPDHLFHASVYNLIALAILPRRLPGVLGQAATSGWSPGKK